MKHVKVKREKSRLQSPILTVILCIVCILFLISVVRTFSSYKQAESNFNEQIHEREQLELYEEELRRDLEFYETERGMEELIRLQHPVVREGEELIVIVPPEEDLEENSDE